VLAKNKRSGEHRKGSKHYRNPIVSSYGAVY
jgi:hypothetical protein